MNNIVIISEHLDKNTDIVIEWLLHFGCTVDRINFEDAQDYNITFYPENGSVKINNIYSQKSVVISNQTVVWHRRGYIPIRPNDYLKTHDLIIENFLNMDAGNTIKGIDIILRDTAKYYIGSWFQEKESYKIVNLNLAKKVGLKIPKTIVTNNKNELISFQKKYHKIISKGLDKMMLFSTKEFRAGIGTFIVTDEMISNLPKRFEPTLFQNCIDKLYEVRIFVFDECIFSMAIFSFAKKDSIRVDVREDTKERPNRCIPYKLPNSIRNKIKVFMKLVDMKTGSIDLILGKDNQYYFLEINPMGQFDWVSGLCNYNIEFTIAYMLKQ